MENKILEALDGLKNQIGGLETQIGDLRTEVSGLGTEVSDLKAEVGLQGNQIKENTQILKALEHLAEVNKAEHEKMIFDIAELRGEVQGVRQDLAKVEMITASNWGDIVKLKSIR